MESIWFAQRITDYARPCRNFEIKSARELEVIMGTCHTTESEAFVVESSERGCQPTRGNLAAVLEFHG
jgi:glutamine amidotransferase-like uncharacterized protein